jgi:hypothetical protein
VLAADHGEVVAQDVSQSQFSGHLWVVEKCRKGLAIPGAPSDE